MTGRVFITGTAGFIGFHFAKRMLSDGWSVMGLDGMTPYYSPKLKEARLSILQAQPGFSFKQIMRSIPSDSCWFLSPTLIISLEREEER